jgi:hypothetical protein
VARADCTVARLLRADRLLEERVAVPEVELLAPLRRHVELVLGHLDAFDAVGQVLVVADPVRVGIGEDGVRHLVGGLLPGLDGLLEVREPVIEAPCLHQVVPHAGPDVGQLGSISMARSSEATASSTCSSRLCTVPFSSQMFAASGKIWSPRSAVRSASSGSFSCR